MKIYTIHDMAAAFFFSPFAAHTDAEASRMFVASLGDSFPHRQDYTLFRIGSFDPDTGELKTQKHKKVLAGLSIPPSENPNPTHPPLPFTEDTHHANGELIK